jgi:hypothetical protein
MSPAFFMLKVYGQKRNCDYETFKAQSCNMYQLHSIYSNLPLISNLKTPQDEKCRAKKIN